MKSKKSKGTQSKVQAKSTKQQSQETKGLNSNTKDNKLGPLSTYKDKKDNFLLSVWIKPNASVSSIVSVGDAVEVAVAAPPREGEANKAIVEYIAKFLGIRKTSVEILQGHKARQKVLLIEGSGCSMEELYAKLKSADTT
ncbi:hypothetical protein BB560_004517 [Smittium megazygosporum]|uniref:Uncharacterized protein n=1 Tax=Smittium megazygosporum TaxID=133381 RepID=A0A2T9Z954_9FUNG|nr:hypothetical protein BB560_004517 [Smittium megazygosporum]